MQSLLRRSLPVTLFAFVGLLALVIGGAALTARPAEAQAMSCFEPIYAKIQVSPTRTMKVKVGDKFKASCFSVGDDRINNNDLAAPVAIYCDDTGVALWDINMISQGTMAFRVDFDYINRFPQLPTENTLIYEQGGYRLYRLTSGELQVNSPPNWEDKQYVFIWNGCDHPEQQHSEQQ